jgi:hypothetical protein
MNTRPAHRLFSVFFAAMLTFGLFGVVDQLAQPEGATAHFAEQAPAHRA